MPARGRGDRLHAKSARRDWRTSAAATGSPSRECVAVPSRAKASDAARVEQRREVEIQRQPWRRRVEVQRRGERRSRVRLRIAREVIEKPMSSSVPGRDSGPRGRGRCSRPASSSAGR